MRDLTHEQHARTRPTWFVTAAAGRGVFSALLPDSSAEVRRGDVHSYSIVALHRHLANLMSVETRVERNASRKVACGGSIQVAVKSPPSSRAAWAGRQCDETSSSGRFTRFTRRPSVQVIVPIKSVLIQVVRSTLWNALHLTIRFHSIISSFACPAPFSAPLANFVNLTGQKWAMGTQVANSFFLGASPTPVAMRGTE